MYAYMKGTALESVMDIPLTGPETAKETLDKYQRRFLPESDSHLLRTQFACVVPNESVQKLHARMRVLFHLAYPDASTRNDIFLIERFIAALNNHEVQNHVGRRKPATYAAALAASNEETSFVLMDLATHAPGGLQAPMPGDTSFIAALKGRRPALSSGTTEKSQCFYCDGEGHIKEHCPTCIRDCLRQQARMGNQRPPLANSRARLAQQCSPAPGRKQVRLAEAANTLLIVAESYGRQQIAEMEEHAGPSGVEDDPLADVDLATYDEATVTVLYEELLDLPEDEPDFFKGQ